MEKLPTEVIELILAKDEVSIEDVLNVRASCSRLKEIVDNSSFIWKQKYLHKWPQFQKLFGDNFSDWMEEIKHAYRIKHQTVKILSTMSSRFYRKTEVSEVDLQEWERMAFERPRNYEYLVLELMTTINTNIPINTMEQIPTNTPGNLTLRYYANRVLNFIKHIRLSKEWEWFINLPEEAHILERGATFVAQWCLPNEDIKWETIRAKLDKIADLVKENLRSINPAHPLFNVPAEEIERWRIYNISKSQFSPFYNKQVMQSISDVLYKQLGFHGNEVEYYMPENSYINKVLEKRTGLPITLAVIFESIARRVGIKCEPISFPAHFLLRYCEEGNNLEGSYYIDVFNSGQISRRNICPRSGASNKQVVHLPPASLKQVVERMANNLEIYIRQHMYPHGHPIKLRTILELQQLTDPRDLTTIVSLARDYMQHNMDTKPLVNKILFAMQIQEREELSEPLQRVLRMLDDYEVHRRQSEMESMIQPQPSPPLPQVQFAVGMVMRHLVLNYICVIYDWDPVCKATVEWQNQMGVHKLRYKDEQPFYNVLVQDGTRRYVAQENMTPVNDVQVLLSNEDVGKYFSHFVDAMFIPNEEKEKEYPYDGEIRRYYYQSFHATKE